VGGPEADVSDGLAVVRRGDDLVGIARIVVRWHV
jgi:hypothetical protein